jgi:gliding motility-associated-like protein
MRKLTAMKKLRLQIITLLLLTSTFSIAQNCNNLGFEDGNFTNWDAWRGKAVGGFNAPTVPDFAPWFLPPDTTFPGIAGNGIQGLSPSQHQITNAASGLDFWSGISMLSPTGGTYSVQLGNQQPGAGAEMIRQKFLVTPSNSSYVYQYAVVFEDPGHIGRPLFEIKIFDNNDSIIPCGDYLVRADQGLSGFVSTQVMTGSGNHYIVYKDWTDVAVDLSPYIGDSITVEFVTADCNAGQHFGYAYIDGYCQVLEIAAVSQSCTNTIDLIAPSGYQSYIWSNGMSGPNITVANGSIGDSITVTLVPFMGCNTSLTYYYSPITVPVANFIVSDTCINIPIQFTDSSYANIINWQWSFGNGNTSNLQNPIYTYSISGTYNVQLIVTNNTGCSDTIVKQVNICGGQGGAEYTWLNACVSQSVIFTDQSLVITADPIISWEWDFDDGNLSSLQNPQHPYGSSGTYNVRLTITYSSGQVVNVIHTITVYDNPAANFSFNIPCEGNATNFTDQSQINIATWEWVFGDGNISNQQHPTHTYLTAGSYNVQLIVANENGCADTVVQVIEVNPNPAVDFGTPQQGCLPIEAQFSGISSATIVSWSWDLGNGTTSTNQNTNLTYNNVGSYDVSLTVTDNNGCSNMLTQNNYINVYPNPVANFNSTPDDVDELDPTLYFTDLSQNNISLWNWNFGDGNTSTTQNPSNTYDGAGVYLVSLYVENAYGCSSQIEKEVAIKPVFSFYVPNAFTPDNDGDNDTFKGKGVNIDEYNMMIFDRWGEKIFETEILEEGWDGYYQNSLVQNGVYVYKIKLKDVLGENHNYIGSVTLVK